MAFAYSATERNSMGKKSRKVHNNKEGQSAANGKHKQDPESTGDAKLAKKEYEAELFNLQVELVKLQDWVKHSGARIVIIFEGRDAAGKGGIIKRIMERVSPRVFRLVALPAPSERQKTQMYVQRYIEQLPAGGEIVIFDRSWYNHHHYYTTTNEAAAACVKAGINQFLDNHRPGVLYALTNNLLTEADIDQVIKGTLRVFIRLGLLDPATNNPYAAIGAGSETEPWNTPEHKAVARLVTQKSIVLLKNSENLLPLDKTKLKSIAVIGPYADEVLLDWYSGTPPYTVTPLQGIKDKVGPGVTVTFATNNAGGEAVKLAKAADVVIVCVGNHPTGGLTNWGKVALPSYGKEAVDRKSIKLEVLIRSVALRPESICYSNNPDCIH